MAEKKVRKMAARAGIFTIALMIATAGAYFITPKSVRVIDLGKNNNNNFVNDDDESVNYLDLFVKHLTNEDVVDTEADSLYGLKASFDNFSLKFGSTANENIYKNNIYLNGDVLLMMKNLNDIQFDADINVTYNEKNIDFAAAYVNDTAYLAFKDLRLKSSGTNTEEIFQRLNWLFFNADNAEGLGMTVDIDNYINDFISNLDITELLSKLSDENTSTAFNITTDVDDEHNEVTFNIDVDITKTTVNELTEQTSEETNSINLKVLVAKDTLDLKRVDLGTIKLGDFVISGALNCETISNLEIVGLDDERYGVAVADGGCGYGIKRGEFVEMISYMGWADKLLNLLQTRKTALNFNATLTMDNEENVAAPTKLVGIDANVNVDFSDAFDLAGLKIGVKEDEGEPELEYDPDYEDEPLPQGKLNLNNDEEEEESATDKILNAVKKIKVGLDVSLTGQEEGEYANLGVCYQNDMGYVALNENGDDAVMRAKISTETVNQLIEKIKEMTAEAEQSDETASSLTSLLSFLTDSELVTAIKDGHYEGILDVLETVKNTSKTIELGLNLSSLGLGDNAEVYLTLDSTNIASAKVLELEISGIEIGSINFDATLSTQEFNGNYINSVATLDAAGKYDELNYLPSVFDQVAGILDSKQAGFTVSGEIRNQGVKTLEIADSWGQFDYGAKYGYGTLNLKQYKDGSLAYNHKINLDVDNKGETAAEKNVKFTYGPNDGIKGKFTIQTVTDIVDLVKTFIKDVEDDGDERFTKFLDPILELLGLSYLGDIINSKDFVKLAKNDIIKEIREYDNGSYVKIVIGGTIMGLDGDLELRLNFNGEGENRTLKGISLPGLNFNDKTIALAVEIVDFDENKATPVNMSYQFMDFSDIKVLLDFGINTTRLNYYHLTADIKVNAIKIFNIDFQLDFYVYVDGVSTRVYGVIDDVPYVVLVSDDMLTDVKSEFVFEPDHSASNNDVGGYFHILRTEVHKGLFSNTTEKYYYRSDSKNFLDSDNSYKNLIYYLVVDMLDIKSSLADMIIDASLDTGSNSNPDYEKAFTDTGFQYTDNGSTKNWKLGLDLKSLTGVSALGDIELSIDGKEVNGKGYLSGLNASLKLVKVVEITAKINVLDINPEMKTWPSSVHSKYNTVIRNYNALTAASKATFDSTYMNKPLKPYKVK